MNTTLRAQKLPHLFGAGQGSHLGHDVGLNSGGDDEARLHILMLEVGCSGVNIDDDALPEVVQREDNFGLSRPFQPVMVVEFDMNVEN